MLWGPHVESCILRVTGYTTGSERISPKHISSPFPLPFPCSKAKTSLNLCKCVPSIDGGGSVGRDWSLTPGRWKDRTRELSADSAVVLPPPHLPAFLSLVCVFRSQKLCHPLVSLLGSPRTRFTASNSALQAACACCTSQLFIPNGVCQFRCLCLSYLQPHTVTLASVTEPLAACVPLGVVLIF